MIRRRLVFAAPFVVVACGSKTPAVEAPEDDDEPAPPATPPRLNVYPIERKTPAELVDELEPLTKEMTIEDVCRRALCNPPPPYKKRKPDPLVPVVRPVQAMKREANGGTRVRVANVARFDRRWHVAFVTSADNPTEIPNGGCEIVAWDFHQLECITPLSAEEVSLEGHARPVRIAPPPDLVRKVQDEIDQWVNGGRARVIRLVHVGADLELSVSMGRKHGVEKDWRITATREAACTIQNVAENYTTCRVKLTEDQVQEDPFVTLTPPR